MAKIPAVTFKNDPPLTGLGAVGHTIGADIKVGGKVIGKIQGMSWNQRSHKIRVMVLDETERCGWKWVQFKFSPDSLPSAKEWIKKNWATIHERYKFHMEDD